LKQRFNKVPTAGCAKRLMMRLRRVAPVGQPAPAGAACGLRT